MLVVLFANLGERQIVHERKLAQVVDGLAHRHEVAQPVEKIGGEPAHAARLALRARRAVAAHVVRVRAQELEQVRKRRARGQRELGRPLRECGEQRREQRGEVGEPRRALGLYPEEEAVRLVGPVARRRAARGGRRFGRERTVSSDQG
jgi:regulator of protease activity HflC (stomatin/prohibitin superfamily)